MIWANVSVIEIPVIQFTYIGIIRIPVFKDVLVKNPSDCRLESFINLGILRIVVFEVPIIEDLLYQAIDTYLDSSVSA